MAFRAFYALPVNNFSTSDGQPTNVIHGFLSMLTTLVRTWEPTHIAVCFDISRRSFRTELYGDYKGTRDKTPEEFIGQIDLLKEVLEAANIVCLSKENYEADDLIATLATHASREKMECYIVTSDRDALQLVDDQVTVLMPQRGVSEMNAMDAEAVYKKYGVYPARYCDLAALVGEKSDNLIGVDKIGPKTAAKLIAEFDGLDNLLQRADEVKGVAGQNLRDSIERVRLNRQLNSLVRDLDLPISIADTRLRSSDGVKLNRLFDRLEFVSLRQRFFSVFPPGDLEEKQITIQVDKQICQPDDLSSWLEDHGSQPCGLVLCAQERWPYKVYGYAISDGKVTIWIEAGMMTDRDRKAFALWCADEKSEIIVHGSKNFYRICLAQGWQIRQPMMDTELAAYLLRPDQKDYDPADLAERYLNKTLLRSAESDGQMLPVFSEDCGQDEIDHASNCAYLLVELAPILEKALKDIDQLDLLRDIEMRLAALLAQMEYDGIEIDTKALDDLHNQYELSAHRAEKDAWEAVRLSLGIDSIDELEKQIIEQVYPEPKNGKPRKQTLNLKSSRQLQQIIFNRLQMPPLRKIRSGYSTDATTIEQIYLTHPHPFLKNLMDYREDLKLSQAVEGLAKAAMVDSDHSNRIHTTYIQTATATGRLSSAEPNLQNIPIRSEKGRKIRATFVSGSDYEGLMSADYSQIEMRVMAHVSDDKNLIESFKSGVDFHTVTAAKVFSIPVEQITAEQRNSVKQMNYGLAYGLSAYGLASRLKISNSQAMALVDGYFETFGAVRTYLNEVVDEARKVGYTESIFGRRRYLPDLANPDRYTRENAERMALNAPIQGSAADIIKVAMLKVDKALKAEKLKSRILLQIHDELVLEIAPGEADIAREIVTSQMAQAVELKVPLEVSVGYGANWLKAAH